MRHIPMEQNIVESRVNFTFHPVCTFVAVLTHLNFSVRFYPKVFTSCQVKTCQAVVPGDLDANSAMQTS